MHVLGFALVRLWCGRIRMAPGFGTVSAPHTACFLGGAGASAGLALSFLCWVDCFDPSLMNARLLKEFTIVPKFLLFGLIL